MRADEQKTREELLVELDLLRTRVAELESRPCLTREQRLKLAIIDEAPFTLWACDRQFRIVLWSLGAARNYSCSADAAMGEDYSELFVDPAEREQSCVDCVDIIDNGMVQRNFLATDHAKDGSPRTMLTNCFRVYDQDTSQYLQAEVALEISDLHISEERYRKLRDVGIARLALKKRTVDLLKRELSARITTAYDAATLSMQRRREEIRLLHAKVKAQHGEGAARELTEEAEHDLKAKRKQLVDRCTQLKSAIADADTVEALDLLAPNIDELHVEDDTDAGR